jgi:hypothetical protein
VVLLGIGIGIALLMLQNWARWLVIVFYGLSFLGIPVRLVASHTVVDVVVALLPALYLAWAIWYLSQPHVKAAFAAA